MISYNIRYYTISILLKCYYYDERIDKINRRACLLCTHIINYGTNYLICEQCYFKIKSIYIYIYILLICIQCIQPIILYRIYITNFCE